ncbi:nuclear pore complex protein NUP155 isoform X2 [Arabidopsis lyrata subsp. lyrata]|uniref:nuclear pore complex protein NUP155 isoform X2 n=1 Tax=Arabidopsis lyrata subsp. lyrata TaxID=81972 RepID=UPI000A29DD3F|nr:nuclear pore complex protein NUP155 isoform X2 [Arabidopsis lyrata subsp. lyrata]|eukprot:XP_020885908.1 nuclear pore complex protein NUP155 isoform X2 [Arabidopsis lyrata subsp. lyrata]
MTCIASTDKGRIFLAGHNGLIYELLYTIGSPCRLVCCTPPPPMPVLCPDANEWDERLSRDPASVVDLLKELRNNYSLFNKHFSDRSRFWFRDFDPVVEMVVDNERKILHARTKEAALKAYFLGMKGESPIEKLGQVDNLLDHHSPDKAASRTNKLSIVSISPLSSKLESNAHLVAVLSDCTRIYLSTSSSSQSSPNCLRVVTTPNLTIDQRKGLSTKAEIAYCPTLGNCELEICTESIYEEAGEH